MENASKALLIAGAILVVILLISIGVLIINNTGNMQDQVKSSSDSMAAQTFNSQFTAYEGTKVSDAQVRQLKSAMQASNAANPSHQITVPTTPTIISGKTYTVTLKYTNGYVSGATITQN